MTLSLVQLYNHSTITNLCDISIKTIYSLSPKLVPLYNTPMRRLKIEHREKLREIIKKAVNRGDEVLKAVVLYMIAEGRYAKEIAKELGISERGIRKWAKEVVMKEMGEGIDMKDVVAGFLDETSPELRSNTQRVWTYREQVRIRKSTADRYRANVIGFYVINGESVERALERTTGEEVARFLEEIKEANRDKKKIVVVLDNFPAHKSRAVRRKAEELGIRLVYLPPYSPDLNPIEWIFKSIKRVVSVAFIKSEWELKRLVMERFRKEARKVSYADKWLMAFLPPMYVLLLNSGIIKG